LIERALCPILVGREKELAELDEALIDVGLGRGRVVVVGGEAGRGKTRLATELRRRATALGHTALWGSCPEAQLALPYLPIIEAVGNLLATVDITALQERLGVAARDLGGVFPQFGVDSGPGNVADASQAKLRFFEAVLALFTVLAQRRPLLLVIEDLHWADPSTHELLDYIARRALSWPVLIVVTFRTEELDRQHPVHPTLQGWTRSRVAHTIQLQALPAQGVAQMVSSIFDEPEVGSEFRDYLRRRSEGNPFVLEEMLKAALDSGDIFRSEVGWDRRAIAELRIPETVRDTILLRLERLAPLHLNALRVAAVIGSTFEADLLGALCGLDATALDSLLRACMREQLVEEAPDHHGTFRFRHSLTWAAVYGDITSPQRVHLHGRVAAALQERRAPAAERAMHLTGANRVDEAVPLWIEAAEEAIRRHAYADAAELYQRAIPHVSDAMQQARLHGAAGDALANAHSAQVPAAMRELTACIAALEAMGVHSEAATYRVALGRCYYLTGDRDAARREYETARDALEPLGPSEALANSYFRLCGLEDFDCRWEASTQLAYQAIEVAGLVGADGPRIGALMMLGGTIGEIEDVADGLPFLERAYEEAVERDLDILASNALSNRIFVLHDLVRLRDGIPLLQRIRELPHNRLTIRSLYAEGCIDVYLGRLEHAVEVLLEYDRTILPGGREQREARKILARALAELGRPDEALMYAPRPLLDSEHQDLVFESIWWIRTHLAMDTPERAMPVIEELLDHFGGLPPWRLHGPPELADAIIAALVATGDVERATQVAAQAVTNRLEWCPWARLARARVLLARGDVAAARPVLSEVRDAFAEAGYVLDETEARLLLARALLASNSADGAVDELRQALAAARACSAQRLGNAALAMLRELGIAEADPATPPSHHEEVREPSTAVVVSVSPHRSEGLHLLHAWAARRLAEHHGMLGGDANTELVATFDSGEFGSRCVDAVEFALAVQDKSRLLEIPTHITVSGPRPPLAERQDPGGGCIGIVLSPTVHTAVRDWLGTHRPPLTVDVMNGPSESADLRLYRASEEEQAEDLAVATAPALTAANAFRRDGEYWTIAYGGAVVRMKDSKGLRDVAVLLAHPGREIAAIDLAMGGEPAEPARAGVEGGILRREGDAGPLLDDEARHQYRERLVDLEDDIASAEMANDPERATVAREEREFLLAELGAAVGLGGRSRRTLDPAERARKTVTWRIRDSIARMGAADRSIGEHFRRSIRTGTFCLYDPAEPTAWEL